MLNREQINVIKEGWTTSLLLKYKEKFVEFFTKLKHQFEYNATARTILKEYITTGAISKADALELKNMAADLLKMVGLGSIVALPGGMLLMLFLVNSAKHLGIDLIPSHFENIKITEAIHSGINYAIKIENDDADGDRISIVLYNTNTDMPDLIGKLVFEKIWNGHLLIGDVEEDRYNEIFPDDEYVKIEHIKVEDSYAQMGFGRILMQEAIKEIKKTNFNRIYINASPMGSRIPLDDLIKFYESLGFKILFNKESRNAEMYMII
jgi:ribosomal protein S18 acetylase RimI-like enzyme